LFVWGNGYPRTLLFIYVVIIESVYKTDSLQYEFSVHDDLVTTYARL